MHVSVMVVGSGRGNGNGTGASDAFVGAYRHLGEIKKGLEAIVLLWGGVGSGGWSAECARV
jgi:hypothetical protein